MFYRSKSDSYTTSLLGSGGANSFISVFPVLALLLLWTVASSFGMVNELLLPSPVRVLMAAQDIGISLLTHLLATTVRILVGYLLGVVFGVFIGLIMQYSRTAFLLLDGIMETSRPIPVVALIPFFILIFGFAEIGKILLILLGTGLVMAVTTVEAIERVPPGFIRWGLVSGLSRPRLFKMIILPAAFPEMRSGARIALALSVTLVVASEFMGATSGLGYLINVSKTTLSTPTILLTIIILGWLSWFLDRGLRFAFDLKTAWDTRAKGAIR